MVVGARSAVFAPLPRLGLLVVDEEHDPAYKQEGGLLYQARDVALYRGKLAAAAVVLVSATPKSHTYHLAQTGKYRYLNLSRRVTPQSLPEIHLVDLRRQRGDQALKIISRPCSQPGRRALPGRTGSPLPEPPGLCPGRVLPLLRPRLSVPPV